MLKLAAGILLFSMTVPAYGRETPADLVDPRVGTLADFGQLTPAATAPFGMVQLGPDTDPGNHAGYDYAATRLRGFSHTRGVGVGCGGGGGDLLVSLRYVDASGSGIIDKRSEVARAGSYRVRYDGGILAEATATRGSGLLRFTMPRDGSASLRIDPRHSFAKWISAVWHATSSDDLQAEMSAGTVCDEGAYRLFTASTITLNGKMLHQTLSVDGGGTATLRVAARRGDVIEVRTGLSSVDNAGAAMVSTVELGHRSFEAIASATRAAWNQAFGSVNVDGSRNERALFYTSLFRVYQTPVAIDDPNRRHRENDGSIVRSAPGQVRYASWSLWDNYRTQMPLLALLQPGRSADIARSLAALYARGKPQWATKNEPFLTVRTEHAGIALLDMRRKGISGFDAPAALAGMVADSSTLQRDTPDQRIEAAYDDWATAQLAGDLGDSEIGRAFTEKARAYRPMWRSVFQRPGTDGDTVKARGLYQGTLWQYRWAPVFDLDWMADTVGRSTLTAELSRARIDACAEVPACVVEAAVWRDGERDAMAGTLAASADDVRREIDGLNEILRVYGIGKLPHYPMIDGSDDAFGSEGFAAKVSDAVALGFAQQADPAVAGDLGLSLALALLDVNDKDAAIAFEPLDDRYNGAAMAKARTVNWSRYRYTAIVALGIGPDDLTTPLSAKGKLNVRLAAERFAAGLAPFIIVSGSAVHPRDTPHVEALEMRRALIERFAVPRAAIVVEPYARHTTTNLRNATRRLVALGAPLDRDALIVTNLAHSRSIEGKSFVERNQRELGYQPGRIGERVSPHDLPFRPSLASLRVDPADPLDP